MKTTQSKEDKSREPLTVTHPELAAQWYPEKNAGLTPNDVVAGSGKKVWWRCPKGADHEWKTSVVARTRLGSGCPYCAGRKASVTNSLASLLSGIVVIDGSLSYAPPL